LTSLTFVQSSKKWHPRCVRTMIVFCLERFTLEDAYRLAAELRGLGPECASGDDAARGAVSHLFVHLGRAGGPGPACPLVRLLRMMPGSSPPEDERATLQPKFEREPSPSTIGLALRASRGVVPEWNDPARSRAHRFLPISGAQAPPMVSAVVAQLGLSVE